MSTWVVRREEHAQHAVLTLCRDGEPVETVSVPARYATLGEGPRRTRARLIEADVALRLVREHVGDGYSPLWLGRGWAVHYTRPLWVTNG